MFSNHTTVVGKLSPSKEFCAARGSQQQFTKMSGSFSTNNLLPDFKRSVERIVTRSLSPSKYRVLDYEFVYFYLSCYLYVTLS